MQPGARVDPELLEQGRSSLAIHLEGLGLTPRAIEREHELAAQPLAQRMLGHEGLELADEVVVAAEREVGVDPALERRDAKLLELEDRRLGERLVGEVGEGRSAPQRERLAQLVGCDSVVRCRERATTVLDEPLEVMGIDRVGLDLDRVSAGLRHEDVGREHAAQPRHESGERVRRRLGRMVAPQILDQAIARNDLVRT